MSHLPYADDEEDVIIEIGIILIKKGKIFIYYYWLGDKPCSAAFVCLPHHDTIFFDPTQKQKSLTVFYLPCLLLPCLNSIFPLLFGFDTLHTLSLSLSTNILV